MVSYFRSSVCIHNVESRKDEGGNWGVASTVQNSHCVKYGITQHKQPFTVCLHHVRVADELFLVAHGGEWKPRNPVCVSDGLMATITVVTPSLARSETSFTPRPIQNLEHRGDEFNVLEFSAFSRLNDKGCDLKATVSPGPWMGTYCEVLEATSPGAH